MILTKQVIADIENLIAATPADVQTLVARTVDQNADQLATAFYDTLLQNELAKGFLNHATVKERLHGSLIRWLHMLYSHPHQDLAALVAQQRHVGEVHARIHLPLHLVARGSRIIKQHLHAAIEVQTLTHGDFSAAVRYAAQLMDMALEVMSAAYETSASQESRTDEAYRQQALGQNMAAERERQRSNLLEWGQLVLLSIYRRTKLSVLPRIYVSEFGLWLVHKGSSMFEGSPELAEIRSAMTRIDESVLPRFQAEAPMDKTMVTLLTELEDDLEAIKFQLTSLFDRQVEVENGRDTLTRLFNRRFLPSVISREINIANRQQEHFALLLLDIDHFKSVNDTHGHEAGDMVLQQMAALLLNNTRSGDFVFRYGGEELVILLVEVTPEQALQIAEKIRQQIESTRILINSGKSLNVTISIGLAMFDGHPDYQYLIRRADDAMYRAKSSGRNRVCVA